LGTIQDVLNWDEARDENRVPDMFDSNKLRVLSIQDRCLLESLAGGTWVSEKLLRASLGWNWLEFFKTSTRLVWLGWIRARPTGSLFESEFRLSNEGFR